ncbi:MAG: DUF6362 family protein [Alphaproteobacteria bacterium]|jgi:hypothetical protein|nr:DUF6362 family protein [Alphaproteobacteria bacterium]
MDYSKIEINYELVEEWLKITAQVERVMPSPRLRSFYGFTFEVKEKDKFQPTQEQITIYEEVVLRWLKLIDDKEIMKLIWFRSNDMGWKRISKKFNISRQTAYKKYQNGIKDLVINIKKQYFC